MTYAFSRRPRLDGTFYRLTDIASRLSMPPEALLEQAIYGKVQLFLPVPKGLTPYSVHQHGIHISDPLIRMDKATRHMKAPDPLDCLPFNMRNHALHGLRLSASDCYKLRQQRTLRLSLFHSAVRMNMIYGEYVDPVQRNLFYKDRGLASDGWRIACYRSDEPPKFLEGIGYSEPEEFEIELEDLFAISTSIDQFLDDIDTNLFISDLVVDGHIVHIDDRPSYFSERLNQVLDAHWWYQRSIDREKLKKTMWSGKATRALRDRTLRSNCIAAVRRQHAEVKASLKTNDFENHLQKNQSAAKLIDAATRFITPMCARGVLQDFIADLPEFDVDTSRDDPFPVDNEAPNCLIPSEVKALVAGAKLFWGHPTLDLSDPNTQPDRSHVVKFMKYLGFNSADAEHAATIISHNATRGRPPAPTTTKRKQVLPSPAPNHRSKPK